MSIQKHPDYWGADAEEFRPDRWLQPSQDEKLIDGIASFDSKTPEAAPKVEKPLTYMPFLYGPHSCLGQHLALLEIRAVLCILFKNADLELKEGYNMKAVPAPTLKPAAGLPVRFRNRNL